MIANLNSRWRALRSKQPLYQSFYRHRPLPLHLDYRQLPMLALDLELTGLTVGEDQIVEIGAVAIDNGKIDMATALDVAVTIDGSVGDSATIHGIRDVDLATAVSLKTALISLLPLLQGRVLVCHHAPLDLAFLAKGYHDCLGESLPLVAIDTLLIERGRLARQSQPMGSSELQLNHCRMRYQLPSYDGHHALCDAIACAELLLAQAAQISGRGRLPGKALLRR
ncbi:3'-5' exonuclease [Ferrimonas lipolytica]|uniref:3'-5' exonuclease n=1 Tax=Ferrimonas lipolytica TaxID=2724191 RepID=A0A6H1UE06_9GAMM|nr:3'-5' exonuclease [Ferrimonas lipolytica]QIZ76859.1 3'-5' exonuclease [Ferrimonas lipolytica]